MYAQTRDPPWFETHEESEYPKSQIRSFSGPIVLLIKKTGLLSHLVFKKERRNELCTRQQISWNILQLFCWDGVEEREVTHSVCSVGIVPYMVVSPGINCLNLQLH